MRKLYKASVTGEFVFFAGNDAFDTANDYLKNDAEVVDHLAIEEINDIENRDDVPYENIHNIPFGSGDDQQTCDEYFEHRDEAERIAKGLEELDYELEDSFIEDVRELLKKEL